MTYYSYPFNNLNIDQASLNFIKTAASKKAKAELNDLVLIGQVSTNQNLTNIIKTSKFTFKSEIIIYKGFKRQAD